MKPHYEPIRQRVVSEIIDGEAIIMDLRTGYYFSADKAGAIIWDGISAGFGLPAIAARIGAACAGATPAIAADVESFVATLLDHELIREAEGPGAPTDWALPLPAAPAAYETPRLERHGDLQDLALLDPIHDVEDTGWPNRKTGY